MKSNTELDEALDHRNSIIDTMLKLQEYAPVSLKRTALGVFMNDGHQEVAMPMNLRRAQARVLSLIESGL